MTGIYRVTRQELKNQGGYQYKEGDIVVCGKYRIWIKYGNFKRPNMHTKVSTEDDMRDLPLHRQPQYIRNFIEKRPQT